MARTEDSTIRFWEFYSLRHSIGTVFGALILFFLVKQNAPLAKLIFVKEGEPIDLIQVGIFLATGLVYSFIASAPILVFHTGRFLMPKTNTSVFSSKKTKAKFLASILIFPVLFALSSSMPWIPRMWFTLICFLASAMTISQFMIVSKCSAQRSELFLFYQKLSQKRAAATGGIVDSYRHLREHGNAFSIVFLEILFAVMIFAATISSSISSPGYHPNDYETISNLIIVVVVWITPAAMTWLIGCMIEQGFVDS